MCLVSFSFHGVMNESMRYANYSAPLGVTRRSRLGVGLPGSVRENPRGSGSVAQAGGGVGSRLPGLRGLRPRRVAASSNTHTSSNRDTCGVFDLPDFPFIYFSPLPPLVRVSHGSNSIHKTIYILFRIS